MARFDLTDFEWSVIRPLLPTKVRGVPRVDDRRVLNGIFWRLRTGAPWADIPARYGPHTTCVNRFNRWRKAAVGEQDLTRSHGAQELHCGRRVMGLALGELQRDRQAVGVDHGVNSSSQAAARATHAIGSIVFFWALAACWCTRMLEESIIWMSPS